MSEQVIMMSAGEFAKWAAEQFGVDYDDVRFWDMQRDLSGQAKMPEGFEVDTAGQIPADLHDILMARKAQRPDTVRRELRRIPDRSEWEIRDGTAE